MGKIHIIPELNSIEEWLKLAEEYDCAFEYNEFFSPQVLDSIEQQNEIISAYQSTGHDFSQDTMHGAFFDVTIHSEDPLIRDASIKRVYQSMDIASRMGVRGVIFHTGRLANFRTEYYLNHWIDANYEFWVKLTAQYPKQQIFMENMFDEAPDILARLAEEMKNVDNFGVCLDYAHAALTPVSGSEWVRTLAPYIRHMHVNDNDLHNDLHQPVGYGKIDWNRFNQLMERYQIDSSVLIEVNGIDKAGKSLNYLKKNQYLHL